MSSKGRFCLVLLALFLASAAIASGTQDPELKQCTHQCRAQKGMEKEQKELCVQRCEEYVREKHRREGGGATGEEMEGNSESPIERLRECVRGCEQKHGERREECHRRCQKEYEKEKERYEGGGGEDNPVDPQKEYQQCRKQCRGESEGGERWSRERCQSRCEEEFGERQKERGREGEVDESYEGREEGEEEEEEEEKGQNPYVFEDRHFTTGMQTQHGRIRVLQKFTDRLLRGIENYRVMIVEAEPQAFIVPNHWDADVVLFVAKGRATVSLVNQDRRESFNIRKGDILRIRAGTTAYLINRNSNKRLTLVKLIRPVSSPGEFEAFFGAGGENPESFFRAFSDELLEAAFNTRRERVRRLFGQQRQGAIIKASEEQIAAMGRHEEGGIWPFGGESKGTFNIYHQHQPTYSNEYGQLYEVDSSHYRQLKDLDIAVSLANITQGAMTAPYYNSKATKISVVVDGEGYFEMACPHLAKSQGGRERRHGSTTGGPSYQRVSSRLRRGTVVVVPAGHPFVAVASRNQNLQLLCFEINAYNNEKYTLAGRRNVISRLEREAKELAFGMPAREVDEVLRSQEEEFFFRGPRQQHEGQSDA